MNKKAFLLRVFPDHGLRVEGPFPPDQVQRYIDKGECFLIPNSR